VKPYFELLSSWFETIADSFSVWAAHKEAVSKATIKHY
jgi:hypothetical protein